VTSFLDRLGPSCPECGEFVAFWKTQWGLGKNFACKRCGTELVIPKTTAMSGIVMLGLFYVFRDDFAAGQFALFGLIIAVGLPATWLFTKPRRTNIK
jgi:ribosomal protein S27AE